jgi:hypothetical protein
MHAWMCASLVPELLNGFCLYSLFKSSSFPDRCLMNLNFPASDHALIRCAPKQNSDFPQNDMFFISFHSFMESILVNKIVCGMY